MFQHKDVSTLYEKQNHQKQLPKRNRVIFNRQS